MRKPDRITVIFGAVVLTAVVVVGAFSAAAASGSQQDPLVTLSYLTQVVTPQLMNEVDKQVAANEQALESKINAAINDLEAQLGTGGGQSASFTPVTLAAGKTLTLQAGCEILPRAAGVRLSGGTLADATSGGSLAAGGTLSANHLYVASQDSCTLSAPGSVTLLVRGSFTLS